MDERFPSAMFPPVLNVAEPLAIKNVTCSPGTSSDAMVLIAVADEVPFGNYLRFRAGLQEPIREVCVLAVARECNSAFEWAAHEPEALSVGVPAEIIKSIKFREPTAAIEAPFGTVVEVIREAFTERSVSAATYDAAVSLLGVPLLIDLITLAGTYASTAALLAVFDMQLDPGETHLLPSLE